MLADSIVSLGWLVLRPLFRHGPRYFREMRNKGGGMEWRRLNPLDRHSSKGAYASLPDPTRSASVLTPHPSHSSQPPKRVASRAGLNAEDEPEPDAPPGHLISTRTVTIGLLASLGLCIITVHLTFPGLIPFYATVLSLLLALPLSIMGVRALGETDLNPVSGISKITQLFFALLITSTSASGTALINLVAGAISEAGALQAGDMMQDLKTGHILGASPKAQFYGQLIGGFVGSIVSALVYRMYTTVYEVPGELFQIPTG
ncbi:MAG: hypothetical protein M1837_007172 [Sclerophora amabilis]|nr:MAG: hypothetical protein M1837_007172 [Sclerophora amabilis]